jgi:hypothetical protein
MMSGGNWWLVTNHTDYVFYGGFIAGDFANDHAADGDVAGRTYIHKAITFPTDGGHILQDGLIRQVWFWPTQLGSAWKFKVFRPNGANYDFVTESEEFVPGATGIQARVLTLPMHCQPGDVLGVYLNGHADAGSRAANGYGNWAGKSFAWAAGDVVATDAFADVIADHYLDLAGYGYPPFMVTTGDSILEGHNTAVYYHGWYDTGPQGLRSSEIAYKMRNLMSGLEYQNHCKGGQSYNWVDANFTTVIDRKPRAIVMLAGVNDVAQARTWAQVVANLDSIKVKQTLGKLFVCEILPWNTSTDAEAATTRTFNTNIAAWCAANDAVLIACHDLMGQVRVSTGELDDLKTAYNQDGIHLKQAGVDMMAQTIKAKMAMYF